MCRSSAVFLWMWVRHRVVNPLLMTYLHCLHTLLRCSAVWRHIWAPYNLKTLQDLHRWKSPVCSWLFLNIYLWSYWFLNLLKSFSFCGYTKFLIWGWMALLSGYLGPSLGGSRTTDMWTTESWSVEVNEVAQDLQIWIHCQQTFLILWLVSSPVGQMLVSIGQSQSGLDWCLFSNDEWSVKWVSVIFLLSEDFYSNP